MWKASSGTVPCWCPIFTQTWRLNITDSVHKNRLPPGKQIQHFLLSILWQGGKTPKQTDDHPIQKRSISCVLRSWGQIVTQVFKFFGLCLSRICVPLRMHRMRHSKLPIGDDQFIFMWKCINLTQSGLCVPLSVLFCS